MRGTEKMKTTKNQTNIMKMTLPAISVNEGVARSVVGAFCAQLDPTIEEIADIKCSVSEAVTNCIVHAYSNLGGLISQRRTSHPHFSA